MRQLEVGDKVLVLLPMQGDALRAKFSGPYVVEKKLSKDNYVVYMPDRKKVKRVCHINMLKKYHERVEEVGVTVSENDVYNDEQCTRDDPVAMSKSVACEDACTEVQDEAQNPPDVSLKSGMVPRVENSRVLANPEILFSHLSDSEMQEVVDIFQDYPDVCSDKLGCAKSTIHKVDVGGKSTYQATSI